MAEGSTLKRKSEDSPSCEPGNEKKKRHRHWTQGLRESMSDPELVIESDDKCVVIKDKYPKARHHFLVLPKESIPNLKSLKPEHLDLLKHLHRVGEDMIEKTDQDRQFRLGYHAVPSMSHLHLHVISQDFHSPCLKTKRHWNSFTTEYFIDSEDIINRLEIHGRIRIDSKESERILKQDLRCHVCEKPQNNIPSLKAHLVLHDYTKSDLPYYERLCHSSSVNPSPHNPNF